MVKGVVDGYEKKLQIEGVGFKARAEGEKLILNVGFSHPVEIIQPAGIKYAVEKNIITIINTHSAMDALILYREGVDFVIFPEYLAGQKVADYLTHLDPKGIKKWGKLYRMKLVEEIRNNKLFM